MQQGDGTLVPPVGKGANRPITHCAVPAAAGNALQSPADATAGHGAMKLVTTSLLQRSLLHIRVGVT